MAGTLSNHPTFCRLGRPNCVHITYPFDGTHNVLDEGPQPIESLSGYIKFTVIDMVTAYSWTITVRGNINAIHNTPLRDYVAMTSIGCTATTLPNNVVRVATPSQDSGGRELYMVFKGQYPSTIEKTSGTPYEGDVLLKVLY